ncbi:MAG TPA: tRNA (adenosine(37)-N6)-dimethylallyltransferase MiaA [Cyanothece sp. UBA12306]|nr:tRNA (adenosine(37)-N6)-dimethylallyltransferase MiaA [Cyanothece sp. UBA12306]
MKRPLIVLCGATATGKSRLALELAQRLNSIIISADSRQVYREFDIGTAKPTQVEQSLVPHYLINICQPAQTLTLAQYQEQANALINCTSCVIPPLLVGGTGLYIKSIVRGLKIPRVAPQPELRSQLQTLGQGQCYELLHQIDPMAASKIHSHDQVRTLRALEVFYVTGSPISQQQGESPPSYPILQIGLDCDSISLQKRIERRTQKMIDFGLVEEVERLVQKYGWDLPLLNTLGYGEIKQYLQGTISLQAAKAAIILHTRQFAKRQRTWFRAYPEIQWFDVTSPHFLTKVWSNIQNFLDKSRA